MGTTPPSTVARIRRIDSRHLASGSALAGEGDFWRETQVRFIGIAAFFILSFGTLFVFKMKRWIAHHAIELIAVTALVVVAGAALVIRRRRVLEKPPSDSEELIGSFEIEARLRSGQLRPSDLVFEAGVWTTLLNSAQFYDAAELQDGRRRRRASAIRAIAILAGILLAIGLVALFLSSGPLLDWLIHDDD